MLSKTVVINIIASELPERWTDWNEDRSFQKKIIFLKSIGAPKNIDEDHFPDFVVQFWGLLAWRPFWIFEILIEGMLE